MKKTQIFLFVLCFFVAPLIFFTNLTRNPYITQIVLQNIVLLLAGSLVAVEMALAGSLPWPKTPMDAPLLGLASVAALSWLIGYVGHAVFYRPAIISQGEAAFLFLGANVFLPFCLSVIVFAKTKRDDTEVEIGAWISFVLIWGVLWLGFPSMRPAQSPTTDIWGQFWSGYGALVWALGVMGAFWLCRKNRWIDYLHLALAVGFIASVYGVIQYFNLEFIWPYALNPYGGRSVSTFGNPNFLSSFNVVLLPIAVALYAQAKGVRRNVYGAVALALEAALLCSLTRSSWLGAAVALAILLLSREFRQTISKNPRSYGFLFGMGLVMALCWPESSIVVGYRPSAMGRLIEFGKAMKQHSIYSPLYQRLLIWISAWLMGKENPLTGQGFGLFELFYPFYQGPILIAFDSLRGLRTHANNAHNEILEYWSQMGILGVGVLFWMWVTFFKAVKIYFRSRRKEDWVFIGAAAGIAGMLIDNLLNVSIHFAVPGFIFWWIAGMVMASVSLPAAEDKMRFTGPSAAWSVRRVVAAAAAAVFCATSWYWVKTWNREVHYFAGFKLNRISDTAGAIEQLELARSWGPREVNTLYELGNSYAKAQRYDAAREAYLQALWSNAGYDEIYYNIGDMDNAHLGKIDEAIEFLKLSLFINPLSAPAYSMLTDVYLHNPSQYWRQAIAMLKQAVAIYPLVPDYWNNLGYLYTLQKRYGEAEMAYAQALSINPDLQIARHNLSALVAQAHMPKPPVLEGLEHLDDLRRRIVAKDMSDATLALAQKTAQLLPQAPMAQFYWGALLLARGNFQQAVAPLQWVVQNNPQNETAYLDLAAAYRSLGQLGEAQNVWRRVLSMDPSNQIARQGLQSIQNSLQ